MKIEMRPLAAVVPYPNNPRRNATSIEKVATSISFVPMEDGRWQIRVGERVLIVDGAASVEEVVSTVISEDRPARSVLHPTTSAHLPSARTGPRRTRRSSSSCARRTTDASRQASTRTGSARAATDSRNAPVELDPHYVDVSVQRWQEYTGEAATLLADGRSFDSLEPRLLAA